MKLKTVNGQRNICGKRLKEVRNQRDLSQEELAASLQLKGLDLSQTTISLIETEKRIVTDFELKYLSIVLKVSICELLGMEENDIDRSARKR